MADSQQAAASQPSQQEILDLQDELGFQKVLLKSIDETVYDYENAAQQVTQEIAQLEKRLKVLKRGTRTTASSSSHISSSKSSQASHTSPSKKTPIKKRSDQPSADGEAYSMNGYMSKFAACFFQPTCMHEPVNLYIFALPIHSPSFSVLSTTSNKYDRSRAMACPCTSRLDGIYPKLALCRIFPRADLAFSNESSLKKTNAQQPS
jgi:hypothetical protein